LLQSHIDNINEASQRGLHIIKDDHQFWWGGISRERTLVLLLFETTLLYLYKNRMPPPSSANSTLMCLVPKGIKTFLSVHVLSCAEYSPT